jgi:hypothetical protein
MICSYYRGHCLFMLIAILGFHSLMAQDSLPKAGGSDKWHFRVEPYLMFPNMSGSTGIGALPLVSVDANASDIFSKLKMGGMLYLEASNDKWAINSDFLYMNLEQDITPSSIIKSGSVNAKQMGWELAGLRRVSPWLEFGVGGLLNAMKVEEHITRNQVGGGETTQSASKSKTWFDPMLITRMTLPSKGKLMGQLRAEIGGFGVGSDLAIQAQVLLGYKFSKLFDMNVGYRLISLDYESGDGGSTFIYDINTFGPMLRFGFSF